MQRSTLLLLGITCLTLTYCKENGVIPKPKHLVNEEVYLKILVELQLLDAWVYAVEDSEPDSLKKVIFEYYNVIEEHFRRSHIYYQSNVDEHIIRIDSALKALEKEKIKLGYSEDDPPLFDKK